MRGMERLLYLACLLLMTVDVRAAETYAVALASRTRLEFEPSELQELVALGFQPYVTFYEAEGRRVKRLRIGPFPSMAEAHAALQSVRDRYPGAWVVAVKLEEERRRAEMAGPERLRTSSLPMDARVDGHEPGENRPTRVGTLAGGEDPPGELPRTTPEGSEALAAANKAAARGDYDQAIRLYTRAQRIGGEADRQQALELIGVAREYKGQEAHAKAAYQQYLATYPDSPQAPQVEQRLAALVTRHLPKQARLRELRRAGGWDRRGLLSQYYRRYAYEADGADEVVSVDALFTDFNGELRRRGSNAEVGVSLFGSHIQDFAEGESDVRLSGALVDVELPQRELSLRLGRQSRHAAGILGRFDGLFVEYGASSWLDVGVVGGYAVRSTFDTPNSDRPFYGVSASFSGAKDVWSIEPFAIEQRFDGMIDRRAVGAEIRYYGDRLTAFSLTDYDVYHDVLNNAQLIAHLSAGERWRFHGSYDYRRSPYLTTEAALIGQGYDDLSQLEQSYATHEILDLANDRTALAKLASLGVDRTLGERFQINLDVSMSDYSETEESGDVAATPARTDLYYSTQLRGEDIFGRGSFGSVQVRYTDGDVSEAISAYLTGRLPLSSQFRVYPKFRYDYRTYQDTGQTQTRLLPSVRLEFRRARSFNLELEAGHEWASRKSPARDIDTTGYFVRLGYRALF